MLGDFAYSAQRESYPAAVTAQVRRFRRFAALCGVELEPFQLLIMAEFFSGRRELIVLLPRGNGKTTLYALVALWTMLTVERGDVYIAASTARQAGIMWKEARRLAQHNPSISKLVKYRHNYLATRREGGGSITVVASDNKGKNHGLLGGVLFLVDELHAHVNNDTYLAFRTALGKRPDAQMVVISTSGMRLAGTLFDLRREAAKLPVVAHVDTLTHTLDASGRVSFLEWALPQDTDPNTITADDLKRANPATFVSVEFLQEQLDAPGLRPEEVACFHACVWARTAKSWLAPGAWQRCHEPGAEIPLGASVWGGLDIGVYQDSSALVLLHERADGRVVPKAQIWTPPGDGSPIDLGEVLAAVRQARHDYDLQGLVIDRWNMEYQAQLLDSEGLLVVDHPMRDMASASQMTYEAINTAVFAHDGDPELTAHVAAGVTVHTAGGWKLTKASRKLVDQIDALIALAITYRVMRLNGGTTASVDVFSI